MIALAFATAASPNTVIVKNVVLGENNEVLKFTAFNFFFQTLACIQIALCHVK